MVIFHLVLFAKGGYNMKNLYFIRSNGERILVEPKIKEDNTIKFIKKFVKEKNPNFEIYYIRSWKTEEGIMYDVGSHTEFFLLGD